VFQKFKAGILKMKESLVVLKKWQAIQEDKRIDRRSHNLYNKYLLKTIPGRRCVTLYFFYLSKPAWVLELERPVFESRFHRILAVRS